MARRTLFRKYRSKRRRGVVLLEAVIVIPVLTLILAGGIMLHAAHAGRIEALYAARQGAWTRTIGGCDRDVDLVASVTGYLGDQLGAGVSGARGDGFGDAYLPSWRSIFDTIRSLLPWQGTLVDTREVTLPPNFPGAERLTVSASMGCNETPHNLGTDASLKDWSIQFIKTILN